MAQQAAGTQPIRIEQRARQVWIVLILSMTLCVVLCGSVALAVYGYLGDVTVPKGADISPLPGSSLIVQRHNSTLPEFITGTTSLLEGDMAQVRSSDQAFVQLFDASTIHVYFDTQIGIERLRESRFFQKTKEIGVLLRAGTAKIATADQGGYTTSEYTVTTDQAEIDVQPNTRLRVSVEGADQEKTTQVVVDAGRATMRSQGKRIDLGPEQMAWVVGAQEPQGPTEAQLDLINNGDFKEPPTSEAETIEDGGLGTAAWLPMRDENQSPDIQARAYITTEDVFKVPVYAAVLESRDELDRYARVGIRQDINQPVDFYHRIELTSTMKVIDQALLPGGPRGDVYPLTIRVTYTDSEGRPHEWKRSFYYDGAAPEEGDESKVKVPRAVWVSTEQLLQSRVAAIDKSNPDAAALEEQAHDMFVLKSPTRGQDMAVLNSIEIYGDGTQFQSWITGISLMAK
jgi:hypothetical protein